MRSEREDRLRERLLWITKIKNQLLIFTNTNAYESFHTWVWLDSVIATQKVQPVCKNEYTEDNNKV